MVDEENKSLVAKSIASLATTGRGANNVLSQITSDALEIAKDPEPKLISFGGYDFNETSYKQLKIWSQRIILNGKLGSEIEDVVDCIDKYRKSLIKINPRNVLLQNWLFKGSFQTICFPKHVQWSNQAVDLSHTPNLKLLLCSNNHLVELDLSHTPALNYLFCSENQLSDLDLSNTPELIILHCSNNNLSELDLSYTPNLKSLMCFHNQLSELDLS